MTVKRIVLTALTLLVLLMVGSSLVRSWGQPQITNRLQLYQTNLLLTATAYEGEDATKTNQLRRALLGEEPLQMALTQYQTVRDSAEQNLERLSQQLADANAALPVTPPAALDETTAPVDSPTTGAGLTRRTEVNQAIAQQRLLLNQLDLSIGIIQAADGDVATAQATWQALSDRLSTDPASEPSTAIAAIADTVPVLSALWDDPPRLLPDTEPIVQRTLEGWFRATALSRLYTLQQRPDSLAELQAAQQTAAESTLVKLGLVGSLPVFAGIVGVGLLIFLIVQRALQGKQAVLALAGDRPWVVPWDWEIVWQVLIVGFFFVGQIAVPLLVGGFSSAFAEFGIRARAVYSLTYYLLMAGAGLAVLYASIRQFFPLTENWFRLRPLSKWPLWGFGGYLIALPLMIAVSLANQQIWQGQGGSNPLLQIVLEEGDPVALGIFLFTAAVAAPVFEETLFRGFLLPSLTRYVPVWGAIALSSLLFAVAHLSISEILPLATLGSVLGFVYCKSRSLLAPILLHSLWNSVTMIGLFILGSGAR
ncbi:MAG: CPBP family intramembrane metalloprotease [Kaiparowitsia implicata GSE-PSE-MK54-09C]|nr:CPBP family intramembrane metalloprotease [Kaiparowitsia implicata GSE-PSE-MK54-09C]